MTCPSGNTLYGGRHRKGHKGRKTRKMRGGMGHGMGAAINAGNFEHAPSNTSVPMDASGRVLPDPFGTDPSGNGFVGGKRRTRKGKKGGKKSRKTKKAGRRHKKMRGGAWSPENVNSANTGYGYNGPTAGITGGIAPASGYAANVGGAPMGGNGVRSA